MFTRQRFLAVLVVALLPIPSAAHAAAGAARSRAASSSPAGWSARTPTGSGLTALPSSPRVGGDIAISEEDSEKSSLSVAYGRNHEEYLVVWHNVWTAGIRDIHGRRVSTSGQPIGAEFVVFAHDTKDCGQPSVAYDPLSDRYLVVFAFDSKGDGKDYDLYGRYIPWSGPSLSLTAFPIITWTSSQWTPNVAYADWQREFLVVWTNFTPTGSPPPYVSGRRINPGEEPDPAGGADVTLLDAAHGYTRPSVAYNLARNEYLVAWEKDESDIMAVRLTASASQMGTGPFVVAGWPAREQKPSVAACRMADRYLAVWQSDESTAGANYNIYGYFVTGDASLDAPPILVDNTSGPEMAPSVACGGDGTEFLVTYQQIYTTAKYGITGRMASTDHHMNTAFPIVQPGPEADRTNPAVASALGRFIVVWEHQREGTSYVDVHGRVVTSYQLFMPATSNKTH